MNKQEFARLMGFHNAKKLQHQHRPFNYVGKRLVKGRARGVCQILQHSFVKPQVGIEKVFKSHLA